MLEEHQDAKSEDGRCGRDNKISCSFYIVPFGSQQNMCTTSSVSICAIHFLALKLIALRSKRTFPGLRWECDLGRKGVRYCPD